MALEVSSTVIGQLHEEAARAHPEECCGILLGEGGCIAACQPARNVHTEPRTHFEIDPQALIDAHRAARDGGPEVIGYYHSHPVGSPEPSRTDHEMAPGDGMIWAIVAAGSVAFWRAGDAGFEPLPYVACAR